MKKSIEYVRYGDITLCTVKYENGLSHSASAKHPDDKEAQKLAYKALQKYVSGISAEFLRFIKEDVERVQKQISDGQFARGVRVEVDGIPLNAAKS